MPLGLVMQVLLLCKMPVCCEGNSDKECGWGGGGLSVCKETKYGLVNAALCFQISVIIRQPGSSGVYLLEQQQFFVKSFILVVATFDLTFFWARHAK